MAAWNAEQYLKYAGERTQPAIDLAARIPVEAPQRVVDIGCGPGNSTEVLARRFPNAHILGVDNSPEMIKAAREAHPQLEFALCDAATGLEALGTGFDVAFSNACIQWVPDHPALLWRMLALLRPGGALSIQDPMNFEEPIHRIIAEVSCAWLAGRTPRIFHTLTPGDYYDLLAESASSFCMWETTYYHTMRSHEDILEWYRGTGLRPYLALLPEADCPAFERDILTRVAAAYPKQKNGGILFRFPRLFMLATR
jgi:trans-aconitate 2-methyltransferase